MRRTAIRSPSPGMMVGGPNAPTLALLAAVAAGMMGCVICSRGQLSETPAAHPGVARPSLSYAVTFLPPDEQRKAKLTEEFTRQLTESGLFGDVQPEPAEAQLTLSAEIADVNLSTGRTLMTYLCTGGLWPVRIPYRYELKATVRRAAGPIKEYELTNEASCRVWLPAPLQGFGDLIEPRSQGVRIRLYHALLSRMAEDGLLDSE